MTEMQESSWPANCPETLFNICLEYCALNLDKTVCRKSADGQLVLKSEVFLPPYVCDALLLRLHPVGREHLPLLANPTAVNFRHINLKSVTDLTDAELQNVLAHHPTDLRISSEQTTEDLLDLISSESHNLRALQLIKCENMFSQISRSKKRSLKKKFRKGPEKRSSHLLCPKVRYIAMHGVQIDASETLCSILSDLTLLTRLNLSDSNVNFQHLHAALSQLQKLQVLSLYNVSLSPTLQNAFEAVAQVKSLRSVLVAISFISVLTDMSILVLLVLHLSSSSSLFHCCCHHFQHYICLLFFSIA